MIADQRQFPVALIVPDFAALHVRAERDGIAVASDANLCRDPHLIALITNELDRLSQELAPYERVKRFALLDKRFAIDSGEVTPTMKVKRRAIAEKYKELIDSLYADTDQERSDGPGAAPV
jgi:long-chain acyl-CoA synthetase